MGTVILGLDPGPRWTGWGLVSVEGSAAMPVVSFLLTGEIESSVARLARLVDSLPVSRDTIREVAVERVGGSAFKPGRGGARVSSLLASSEIAGVFIGWACTSGLSVNPLTARQWRKVVCDDPAADDATVKAAVTRFIRGMPARSNDHNRDALGVAIASAMGARGELSPEDASLTKREKTRRALKVARGTTSKLAHGAQGKMACRA